jgi:hypothetical protein
MTDSYEYFKIWDLALKTRLNTYKLKLHYIKHENWNVNAETELQSATNSRSAHGYVLYRRMVPERAVLSNKVQSPNET